MNYVVCYVPMMKVVDHLATSHIVLVEKQKPEWQAGWLNLPGGKMEEGESPYECAQRELYEETGLSSYQNELMGQIIGEFGVVHVVRCLVPHTAVAYTRETEQVFTLWLDEALAHPKLIPNLRLIIALCHAGVKYWSVEGTRSVLNAAGMDLCFKVLYG